MKRIAIIIISLSLTGCASLPSFLNPFSSDEGVSVEAQVGKTNEKVTGIKSEGDTVVGMKKTNTAEYVVEDSKYGSIKATNVNVDEQVPVWIWLLMVLGWLLPSPQEIWKGLGTLMINIKKYFT